MEYVICSCTVLSNVLYAMEMCTVHFEHVCIWVTMGVLFCYTCVSIWVTMGMLYILHVLFICHSGIKLKFQLQVTINFSCIAWHGDIVFVHCTGVLYLTCSLIKLLYTPHTSPRDPQYLTRERRHFLCKNTVLLYTVFGSYCTIVCNLPTKTCISAIHLMYN